MHFLKNKIEDNHELKKYDWQKKHISNQTGTEKAYNPKKYKNATKKNTIHGTISYLILLILFLNVSSSFAQENSNKLDKVLVEMNVLDKVSSKIQY